MEPLADDQLDRDKPSTASRLRLLNGSQLLLDVSQGIHFIDGIEPRQDAT
ncbi:hypothetical protein I41_01270 [Lacipirellula limnantheis]|uniref:Uncharacterized protein n=1 Tax=Lacipirellula limnantheis TaxID=2528024 RepID=A0A517TRG3_9BACT|nr:hypothetical protein I41_01270 [Lacipirellula limnantheis]